MVTGFIREATSLGPILRSFKKVVDEVPNARLYICGGIHPWDKRTWLDDAKALAQQLNLEDHVVFMEKVLSENQLSLLGFSADIFVAYRSGYYRQIYSGSAMRAVSARKPSVLHDVYALQHITKGCIRVNDESELAEAMIRLFTDASLYSILEAEVKELYEERRFSKIALQLLEDMRLMIDGLL
jgi:glycosyltransferase involved in cell wall biosynthesis